MTRRCRRPTCRRRFVVEDTAPESADLLFCDTCRSVMLGDQFHRLVAQANAESDFYTAVRSEWDTQIIDENGATVWALDLAARYLAETRPR